MAIQLEPMPWKSCYVVILSKEDKSQITAPKLKWNIGELVLNNLYKEGIELIILRQIHLAKLIKFPSGPNWSLCLSGALWPAKDRSILLQMGSFCLWTMNIWLYGTVLWSLIMWASNPRLKLPWKHFSWQQIEGRVAGVGEVGLREIGIIYFDDGPDVFLWSSFITPSLSPTTSHWDPTSWLWPKEILS